MLPRGLPPLPHAAEAHAPHRSQPRPARALPVSRDAGLKYESTRYLKHLDEHRGKFTLFSGVSHLPIQQPSQRGRSFHRRGLGPHQGSRQGARQQHLARSIRRRTNQGRHALSQSRHRPAPAQWNFSWNEKGVPVPSERSQVAVFRQLFISGAPTKSPAKRIASKPDAASSIKSALRRRASAKRSDPRIASGWSRCSAPFAKPNKTSCATKPG
jgi:hypothetical protein